MPLNVANLNDNYIIDRQIIKILEISKNSNIQKHILSFESVLLQSLEMCTTHFLFYKKVLFWHSTEMFLAFSWYQYQNFLNTFLAKISSYDVLLIRTNIQCKKLSV